MQIEASLLPQQQLEVAYVLLAMRSLMELVTDCMIPLLALRTLLRTVLESMT